MDEVLQLFLHVGIHAVESDLRAGGRPKDRLLCRSYEPDELLRMGTELIESRPADAEGYFICGTALHALGNYRHAADDFEEAVRLQPRHARAWLLLSEVLAKLGEVDRAMRARQHALELEPSLR
jgi:Flp pilus assembly protein TadD